MCCPPDAARAVAAGVLDQPAAGLPPVADRVFARVGRVALAVALLAAAVRGGARTWADIDTDLDAGEEAFGQHPYANAFKAMQIATTTLPDELYQALLGLAVFPPDTRIPVAAITRYWAHTRGRTARRHRRRRRAVGRGGGAAASGRARRFSRSAVRLPAAARPSPCVSCTPRWWTAYRASAPGREPSGGERDGWGGVVAAAAR